MVASIKFTAAQSDKHLRITDNVANPPKVETSEDLLTGGNANSFLLVVVETFDEKTGLVKVEVSRNGKNFATHDKKMPVAHGNTYEIDDSKLPPLKKKPLSETKPEQSSA
ncbi:MAG TPA: hypothetical protein VGX71_24855 [Pseudaminobacter sp.]|nr:hypothetical protein [Pseudaminobacter sp.]